MALLTAPRCAYLASSRSTGIAGGRPVHVARAVARRAHAAVGIVRASGLVDISQVDLSVADCLDEEAMLADSTFPIPPEDLIHRTKAFLATDNGLKMPEFFADDFEFVAPVVGPLKKEPFVEALSSFDLRAGIPDLKGNSHHFRVDPIDPSRVWFTTKPSGTHTGVLAGSIQPTGKVIDGTYQTNSVRFNEMGQVVQFTIGYPMDRRVGNMGGLGGVFGIFYAIGKPLPFPEAQPWKMSKRYKAFQFVGQLMAFLRKKNQ